MVQFYIILGGRVMKFVKTLLMAMLMLSTVFAAFAGGQNEAVAGSELRPDGVPADYPSQDIFYIYGFSPGSVQDVFIRDLMQKIPKTEGWNIAMQVQYKEGAGGRIQWRALANADPDGYTIGFAPSAMFISAIAEDLEYKYDNLSYIFNMMSDPGAIGVAYDSDIETLDDLVAAAKKNPGKIAIGVTSVIGQEGLTMKQIEKKAGVKFNLVAFDGGAEVMTQIMGGHLDGFCLNVSDTTTFVNDKQVKVIATGAQKRSQFLPEVPTYIESGFDVTQVNMRSVAGPKDLPEPIRQYLENCFIEASKDPEIQAKAKELQMPLDVMRGDETKKAQYAMGAAYQQLWEDDPWQ